jgi:ABC-type glutathione transport system ATPase component
MSLLKVENIIIALREKKSKLVGPINLEIEEGNIFALLGASGSGKTIFARSMVGLLPPELYIKNGRIIFEGKEIHDTDFQKLRGTEIFYMPQDAPAALDPMQKINKQISAPLNRKISSKEIIKTLETLNIKHPELVLESYPWQLSNGENQRCILTIAILLRPKLMILDEPTSSLDKNAKNQWIQWILKIKKLYSITMLIISHDVEFIEKITTQKLRLQ